MDMLRIKGGTPLRGTVSVSGAKNAALPIMAATLAVPGRTILRNVPQLRDTTSMRNLLKTLGMVVEQQDANVLSLQSAEEGHHVADYELVRTMRASVCVLGPLLASRGEASVSLPGGCNIGHRPIDLHLKGLAALGAEISVEKGYVKARAARLKGARIFLGGPQGSTVTGTCNVMSAAVLAEGTTVIEAAACEPEVVDLGHFLQACGARIEGVGTPTITIEGVSELQATEYRVIPDRIEAATWMIAAAATGGIVHVEQLRLDHLSAVLDCLEQCGVGFETEENAVRMTGSNSLKPADIVALPYPGFPTDVQAQMTALFAMTPGLSVVTDRVFPDRFMHAAELMRMGARVRREMGSVVLEGVERLSGANVMASDLRASAALIIAALAAEGESTIRRIYHLDRGYENLTEKLLRLGANVVREDERTLAKPSLSGPHWPAPGSTVAAQASLREDEKGLD